MANLKEYWEKWSIIQVGKKKNQYIERIQVLRVLPVQLFGELEKGAISGGHNGAMRTP